MHRETEAKQGQQKKTAKMWEIEELEKRQLCLAQDSSKHMVTHTSARVSSWLLALTWSAAPAVDDEGRTSSICCLKRTRKAEKRREEIELATAGDNASNSQDGTHLSFSSSCSNLACKDFTSSPISCSWFVIASFCCMSCWSSCSFCCCSWDRWEWSKSWRIRRRRSLSNRAFNSWPESKGRSATTELVGSSNAEADTHCFFSIRYPWPKESFAASPLLVCFPVLANESGAVAICQASPELNCSTLDHGALAFLIRDSSTAVVQMPRIDEAMGKMRWKRTK